MVTQGFQLMTAHRVSRAIEQGFNVRADDNMHEVIQMLAGLCIVNRKSGEVRPLVDRKGRLQACYFRVI
jgi:hypothetical protein